jgi:CheY-like chemotaxis protein
MAELRKVLLVDDEPDIRTIVELTLGVEGWDVCAARSGAEAIKLAESERPDVILLDVMMPGMDGVATFAELRESPQTRTIPVVFLTARAQTHEVGRYLNLGAAGVIIKPFDPMTLVQELRRIAAHL